MSKGTKKGRTERRKHLRSSGRASGKAKKKVSRASADVSVEKCTACAKKLEENDRALFVEEEIGRVFCSEDCITEYFQPEIEKLEKEYFKYRTKDDLTPDEREQFSHLRWVTLQEPDEVWQSRTLAGDLRYTLISEFTPGNRSVWCVCTCLFLRGEPSFLYLAFPTKSASLVNHFRKGERVEWVRPAEKQPAEGVAAPHSGVTDQEGNPTDGLAQDWTESETLRAEIHGTRDVTDIPQEEFALYEYLLEKALEDPSELWVLESKDEGEPDAYHFIYKTQTEEGETVWYVVLAQEAEEGDQLEILDHFPTRNPAMLDRFRLGRQELDKDEESTPSKMVH